jgi:uncharacterized membrane protein
MSTPTSDNIDDHAVATAILAAEERTSGEIRVFISRQSPANPEREARRQFGILEMTRTPLRNGVLLYFAPANRAFAVADDESLAFRIGTALTETVRAAMEPAWTEGRFHEAVLAAVDAVGVELSRHFPRSRIDRDDLPNHVLRD